MPFIKPSTATGPNTPYPYRGGMGSVAQNYIDSVFPYIVDNRGGNTFAGNNTFTGVNTFTNQLSIPGFLNSTNLAEFSGSVYFLNGSNTQFNPGAGLSVLNGVEVLINGATYFQSLSNTLFYGEVDGYSTFNWWTGTVNLNVPLTTLGGVVVGGGSILEVTGGSFLQLDAGSTTTINGDIDLNSSSYFTMDGTMDIVGIGVLNVQTGTNLNIQTGGFLNVQSGGFLTLDSGSTNTITAGTTLSNGGTFLTTASGLIVMSSSSAIDLQVGSSLNCNGALTVGSSGSALFNSAVTCNGAFVSNVSTWATQLTVAGFICGQIFPTGSTYTASVNDYMIAPTTTCSVTLNATNSGQQYLVICNSAGSAITVHAPAGTTINGVAYITQNTAYQEVRYTYNGSTSTWTYSRGTT